MSESEIQWMKDNWIREVPDFPKPGILFYDISPMLIDGNSLSHAVARMITEHRTVVDPYKNGFENLIGAPEARGFIIGTALTSIMCCGFVPFRKAGKLPHKTLTEGYQLEYGWAEVQMHEDAIKPGQKILLVDDVLATGGTMEACCKLVERAGGIVSGCSFLIELPKLNGRQKLAKYPVTSLLKY